MLTTEQKASLIKIAWHAIHSGLENRPTILKSADNEAELDPELNKPGACFVTLEHNHQLRGCIGSLEAYRPLAEDVAHNAFSAAFRDSRFPPLKPSELPGLSLQISVLSEPTAVLFNNEQHLLQQLEPGIDGVILEDGMHRATFLPQVWQQLPTPVAFMSNLKAKAGLAADYWSPTLSIKRYHVDKFC
jgi:AmmeMemoRadiSam system protein A